MGEDELKILTLERDFLDRKNLERAKQGRSLEPIPEQLMNEEELERASLKLRKQERDKKKYGYGDNVVFVDGDSEEEEDNEEDEYSLEYE